MPDDKPDVNAYELAMRLLEYFDSYKLATIAPIVCELEKALDQEYRRGVEESRLVALDILDDEGHLGRSRERIAGG